MRLHTYSGTIVDPANLRPEDIRWQDIARSLSMSCRYGGHTKMFYSVAEHCCLLHDYVREKGLGDPQMALLHDASEAYISDIPSGIKKELDGLEELEGRILRTIFEVFNLEFPLPPWFKDLDVRIRADEAMVIATNGNRNIQPGRIPLGVKLHCWNPTRAEFEWIERLRV